MPGTKGGLWTYRRLLDRDSFAGGVDHDLTLFNWPGNDYRDRSILDCAPLDAARALQDAKRVSLGFLHWLQTEAPGDRRAARRAGDPAPSRRDGHGRRPLEASLHPRIAPHPGDEDHRRAGGFGAPPAGPARRALPGLGRHRLVSDRHPSLRPRGRRRELPHAAVPDPAGRAAADPDRQPDRRRQEPRHDAHHQRLLSPAPDRVEHRRGGRRAGGVRARGARRAGGGARARRPARAIPAPLLARAFRSPG